MDSNLLDEYNFKLKLIGIYQIFGGTVGVALTIWLISMLQSHPGTALAIFYFSFLLYLFAIVIGIGLIIRKERFISLSVLLNIPQLLFFFYKAYSFKISTGFPLYLIFDLNEISAKVKFETPLFRVTFWDTTNLKIVGINLVSILMIGFLLKLKSQIEKEKTRLLFEDFNCS